MNRRQFLSAAAACVVVPASAQGSSRAPGEILDPSPGFWADQVSALAVFDAYRAAGEPEDESWEPLLEEAGRCLATSFAWVMGRLEASDRRQRRRIERTLRKPLRGARLVRQALPEAMRPPEDELVATLQDLAAELPRDRPVLPDAMAATDLAFAEAAVQRKGGRVAAGSEDDGPVKRRTVRRLGFIGLGLLLSSPLVFVGSIVGGAYMFSVGSNAGYVAAILLGLLSILMFVSGLALCVVALAMGIARLVDRRRRKAELERHEEVLALAGPDP